MTRKSTDEAFAPPFTKLRFMIERVLVAGGGTMGAGIAMVAAKSGLNVEVVEPDDGARERASAAFAAEAQRTGDSSFSQRIAWTTTLPARSDAGLAIEAVPERFEMKCDVLAALSEALPAGALLATNTSSFSVSDLADATTNPEHIVGLHFFNPPARMQLVEVVRTPRTADSALDLAFGVVERFGKHAVLAADTPGFIVNRVARPYYLQALRALERNAASAPELDALARAVGFRMGPFELMDLIGLDVNLATSESIYARTEAARFEPVELQRAMVAEGLLGRKTGAGFYSYRDGKAARFEPAVPAQAEPNVDELVAVIGLGDRAQEFEELLRQGYQNVQRIANDEMLGELSPDTTILVEVGDGTADRAEVIATLDASFGDETVIIADAYATNLARSARRLRHPQRLVGFGVLGSLSAQSAVEIVDGEIVSDDTLELAQEMFASIGKGAVLVEDVPALFLGRTVGSIVNEAMTAVAEAVASPDDVDEAMMLGANYPVGPIAWGREIGGARLRCILKRLAEAEGERFAPHRSLWLLDVDETPAEEVPAQ